ncbi:MAG: alpha/beta hydrolase [Betaproteobacteria bacterium]|nr:alpha/beta hydrolase [Betaproteobacteria bacterium]
MPHITSGDGVKLYYEEAGQGTPILFVHEFMGEYRSWEAQLRHFSRRYRSIAYNARGFAEFIALVKQHSAQGSALTLKGYQALRPSLGEFKGQMAQCTVPTLIISGDEDEPCLDASLMLKRHMLSAGLVFMPQTGHACNLEEPELFNMMCEKFFHQVESGQYRMRDPRATPERML